MASEDSALDVGDSFSRATAQCLSASLARLEEGQRHRVPNPLRYYRDVARVSAFRPLVGERVRHRATGREGWIRPEGNPGSGRVLVMFDGRLSSEACHPDDLAYLDERTARRARLAWQLEGVR